MTTNDLDWISSSYEADNFYHLNECGEYTFNNIIFGISPLKTSESIYRISDKKENKTYIQLYHGTINGSSIFNGNVMNGKYFNISDFGNYDYLLLGDIHKMQYLNEEKTIAYSGSMIQQNFGESIDKHGYILWNIVDKTSEFIEVHNDYSYVNVDIYDDYVFDNILLQMNKKFINVKYKMYKNNTNAIKKFIDFITDKGIKIIFSSYEKLYVNDLTADVKTEKLKSKKSWINEYIDKKNIDNKQQLLQLHNDISTDIDDEHINITHWNLNELEFQNIFCFGGHKVNKIVFDNNGFYKIFNTNFMGKTSILNIIKWGFYQSDSGIYEQDILHKGKMDNIDSGYIKCKFTLSNSDTQYVLERKFHKTNKLKSGIRINHYLNDIEGKDNVNNKLTELIGTYEEFELISSINNEDLGILRKDAFSIFSKLFKLNDYIFLENKTKHIIKDKNYIRKNLLSDIAKLHNVLSQDNIDLISLEIKELKKLISDIVIKDVNDIIENKNKLSENLHNIVLLAEYPCEECNDTLHEIDTQKLNKIILENKDLITKIQNIVLYDIEKCNECNDELCDVDLVQLKRLYNDNNIIQEKLNNIKFYDEHEECEKNNNDIIDVNPNDIKDLEKQKELLLKSIVNIDLDIDENGACKHIDNVLMKIKTNKDIKENLTNQIENDNLKLQKKLKSYDKISFNEDEVREHINNQRYDYGKIKEEMIMKLNNKSYSISSNDTKALLFLLTETDYDKMLSTILNNKKTKKNIRIIEKRLKDNNSKLIQIDEELTGLARKYDYYNQILNNIKNNNNYITSLDKVNYELDQYYKIIENNNKINEQNKNYFLYRKSYEHNLKQTNIKNTLMKSLSENKSKIDDILKLQELNKIIIEKKNKYDKYLKAKKHNDEQLNIKQELMDKYEQNKKDIGNITSLIDENNMINDKKQKYQNYINAIQHNNKFNSIKESLIKEINLLENEINDIYKNNESNIIKKSEYESSLKSKQEQYNIEIDKLNYKNKLTSELKSIDNEIMILNDYKTIVGDDGIPSLILTEELPTIEDEINKFLQIYTNFSIKINVIGHGCQRKIVLCQTKDGEKELTIKSLSGYETLITNIACKLSIKKYCSIPSPNFIMVDEILSKVSKENYNKLPELFNILQDNYRYILLITHIPEIKDLFESDFYDNGKFINIYKEDNYSVINY